MNKKNKQDSSILIIYTGGTIGMIENSNTGVLEAFDFTYLREHFPEIDKLSCNVEVDVFDPPLDSSSIKPDLWISLSKKIEENYDKFDGFVILHGTDTMAYSASALSFMLNGLNKPVIFTGSQLPISTVRTDGKENMITAIEIAIAKYDDGSAIVPEVCIFFDNHLFRGNRTSKISADQFNAFNSFNYPALAFAGVDITYNDNFILDENRKKLDVRACYDPNVCFLKLFPGITKEFIDSILSIPNLKGVVLETFGSGNAPMDDWFLESLRKAIDRGLLIVNVTQCVNGYVEMARYATGKILQEIGVVSGYDSTSEAAITKMMYLFGCNYDSQKVKELMLNSLCGEITVKEEQIKLKRKYKLFK